jgi:hypothetical protein
MCCRTQRRWYEADEAAATATTTTIASLDAPASVHVHVNGERERQRVYDGWMDEEAQTGVKTLLLGYTKSSFPLPSPPSPSPLPASLHVSSSSK